MLDPIENRQSLLDNRLGTLLTLERDSLNIYLTLEQASQTAQVKDLFNRQTDEAREHITALEGIASTMRLEMAESPVRAGAALHHETSELIDDSSDDLVDLVALAAARAAGRLAIDVYKTTIALCASLGFHGIKATLSRSLHDQEQIGDDLKVAFDDQLDDTRLREAQHFADGDDWLETYAEPRLADDRNERGWSDSEVS